VRELQSLEASHSIITRKRKKKEGEGDQPKQKLRKAGVVTSLWKPNSITGRNAQKKGFLDKKISFGKYRHDRGISRRNIRRSRELPLWVGGKKNSRTDAADSHENWASAKLMVATCASQRAAFKKRKRQWRCQKSESLGDRPQKDERPQQGEGQSYVTVDTWGDIERRSDHKNPSKQIVQGKKAQLCTRFSWRKRLRHSREPIL